MSTRGYEVTEGTLHGGEVGIVECRVVIETRWRCACGASWRKPGIHTGSLKKCRSCGTRFFLRKND